MTTTTQKVAAVATVLVIVTGLLAVTLRDRWQPTPEPTGDRDLSSFLQQNLEKDHRQVAAFVRHATETSFGGLGVGRADEFEIASITKVFTAELLRMQLDRGDLSADTTVGDVLGERVTDTPVADVTVMELAQHTSGLPRLGNVGLRSWMAPFLNRNPYRDISNDRIVEMASEATLKGRGEYRYSNLGFALLGQVLARNAGSTFPQLMEEELLQPLGMTDTYLMEVGRVPDDAPRGGESAEPWEMEGFLPAAGLRSTPQDMTLFAAHILDRGVPDFTWARDEETGTFWHDGGSFGFSSVLVVDPQRDEAAFIASRTSTSVAEAGVALLAAHSHDAEQRSHRS